MNKKIIVTEELINKCVETAINNLKLLADPTTLFIKRIFYSVVFSSISVNIDPEIAYHENNRMRFLPFSNIDDSTEGFSDLFGKVCKEVLKQSKILENKITKI
tara:strand:- start:323 stop:631 length:309 start_codon:yes stop_codon:yes gene_type:complete